LNEFAPPRQLNRWASFVMMVVKQILGHSVTFGGEWPSGWLPQGAAIPNPTPTRNVALNITIESDGAGYLLCWTSSDHAVAGDLWYQMLADAEQAATENFGVANDQWQTVG
jgi:hypothetical protein